jgi:hypothetical protein
VNTIPKALTIIGAIILAIHLMKARILGYGSIDADDVTAIFALAVAFSMTFSKRDAK